ncbi:MAG: hypothetical protein ACT4OZ_08680 [Gemmatimonadota bacterium]
MEGKARPITPGIPAARACVLALLSTACGGMVVREPLAIVPPGATAVGNCGESRDSDADSIGDECELSLARTFAPVLLADPGDCIWLPRSRALAGGYRFAVQRIDGGVRIAYLPAWFRDCGWRPAVCLLTLRGSRCSDHAGDSELIVVDLASMEGGQWMVSGVLLSAHCGGRAGGQCRWYRGAELARFSWRKEGGSGPVVLVARGKHSMYPDRASCDRGHYGQDSCDGSADAFLFPVVGVSQNIGSRVNPAGGAGGCVQARELPVADPDFSGGSSECFWDATRPFKGWQTHHSGSASAYSLVLWRLALM